MEKAAKGSRLRYADAQRPVNGRQCSRSGNCDWMRARSDE